jgi:hypothetical protein
MISVRSGFVYMERLEESINVQSIVRGTSHRAVRGMMDWARWTRACPLRRPAYTIRFLWTGTSLSDCVVLRWMEKTPGLTVSVWDRGLDRKNDNVHIYSEIKSFLQTLQRFCTDDTTKHICSYRVRRKEMTFVFKCYAHIKDLFYFSMWHIAGLGNREYGRRNPSRWPRGTLYTQKLALTSPTSGGRSIGIVLSRS